MRGLFATMVTLLATAAHAAPLATQDFVERRIASATNGVDLSALATRTELASATNVLATNVLATNAELNRELDSTVAFIQMLDEDYSYALGRKANVWDVEDATNALWAAKADKNAIADATNALWSAKQDKLTVNNSLVYQITANEAIKDSQGRRFQDTYALKSQLPDMSNYTTKTELASATNAIDVTEQLAPLQDDLSYVKSTVAAWTGYWGGDDVRVTVTNYFGNLGLPALFLEQKMPADETHDAPWFKTIWDERTRWDDFFANRFAPIEVAVHSNLAQRAWGMYDSATGALVGDPDTLQISHKQILLLPDGLNWETVADNEGNTAWIMVCTAPTYISRPSDLPEGKLSLFPMGEGTAAMEVVQGNKRMIGASAGSCRVVGGNFVVDYPVVSADPPQLKVGHSLTNMMAFGEYFGYPATTANVWSGGSGAWVASIPTTGLSSFFVTAQYEVGGNSYIKNNMAHSADKIVVGGVEYEVQVETVSGKKMLTLTEAR